MRQFTHPNSITIPERLTGLATTVQARVTLARQQLKHTAFDDHQQAAIDRALAELADAIAADVRTLAAEIRRTKARSQ